MGYASVMWRDALFAGGDLQTRLQVAEKEAAGKQVDVPGYMDTKHQLEVVYGSARLLPLSGLLVVAC